jgi:hypothetical protein
MTLDAKTFSQLITFSRSTTGTRRTAAGLVETVAINQPRFDFDPLTGQALGILIEESRTNLLTYSEQLDNAAWSKTRSSVSANATTAPDGTTTADKIVEDSTATSTHFIVQTASVVSGTTYTYSGFFKAAGRSTFLFYASSLGANVQVDLTAKTATGGGTGFVSCSIEEYPNSWFRVKLTYTENTTAARSHAVFLSSSGNTTYSGDGSSGIYAWGLQLEVGTFATSYIFTTSAQVTRAADVATISTSSIPSFNASEGTLVVEAIPYNANSAADGSSQAPAVIAVDGGSIANEIAVQRDATTNLPRGFVRVSNALQASMAGAVAWSSGTSGKIAVAYKSNDFAFVFNGGTVITDTAGSVPTVTTLRLGSRAGGVGYWSGRIKSVTYYPSRLTNAELQQVTTP